MACSCIELTEALEEIKRLKKEKEELEQKYTQTLNELEFTRGYAGKLEAENEAMRDYGKWQDDTITGLVKDDIRQRGEIEKLTEENKSLKKELSRYLDGG